MRKFFSAALLFIFGFFILSQSYVYSQVPSPAVPGISCGNAEASDPAVTKCCQKIDVSLPAVPGILTNVPGVKDIIENLNKLVMTLDRAQNIVPCVIGYPTNPTDPNCTCLKESQITPSPIEAMEKMCQDYASSKDKGSCISCASSGGAWTGIGCIYGDFSKFVTEILINWGIGLAGIIALLCIIYSAFQMQTSQGNPEKIKKAQELLTSCIMGLMLIIFSVFILRLIGVDVLKIPGLSR